MPWLKSAAVALALGGSAMASGAAVAQSITFKGTSLGCFVSGCTAGQSSITQGLSYGGASLEVTTSPPQNGLGFAMFSADPATPNVNSLGSFQFSGDGATFKEAAFTLAVAFSLSSATSPNLGVFSGILHGRVTGNGSGGVKLELQDSPLAFTYPGGGFWLYANAPPTSIPSGGSAAMSGFILASPILATPGPVAGVGLPFFLGLAGLAFYRRRATANAA